jgi:hypothetical protein
VEKSVVDLKFVRSSAPLATVEIDLDSIPERYFGYSDLVFSALRPLAQSDPSLRATVYVYQGPSINFGVQSYSAFFGVAGDKKLLRALNDVFASTKGMQVRYSDHIQISNALCQFHIEGGQVWQPEDALTWSTGWAEEETEEEKLDVDEPSDVESVSLTKEPAQAELAHPRASTPNRFRAARSDASVGAIRQRIEIVFGLPAGSVALCGPNGKGLRSDATVATLRRRWEE